MAEFLLCEQTLFADAQIASYSLEKVIPPSFYYES